MYFVYVIQSKKDNRLYKGFTTNLENRIKEHNSGKTKSTRAYLPWTLVYFEKCENRTEARKREKYLKSGIGRDYLKEIIKRPRSSTGYLPAAGREYQISEFNFKSKLKK